MIANSCLRCKFYNVTSCYSIDATSIGVEGRCQRRAPQPSFPLTQPNDWCGDFRAGTEDGLVKRTEVSICISETLGDKLRIAFQKGSCQ